MKISVIVPVGPEGSYLPDLMQSLREQTLQADEVVIVDDAAGLTPEDVPGCTYYRNPWRLGEVASRNIGIAIARNDWVFQAAHDDMLYPDCLRRCADVATDEAGYYYTILALGRAGEPVTEYQGTVGAHALFHRRTWARLGGYPLCGARGLADIGMIDLWMTHGGPVYRVGDEPLYWHRTHEHNGLQAVTGVMRDLNRQASNETTATWREPGWLGRFGYGA